MPQKREHVCIRYVSRTVHTESRPNNSTQADVQSASQISTTNPMAPATPQRHQHKIPRKQTKERREEKKKRSQLTIASRSIFAAAKASSITATRSLLLGNIMTGIVGPARPGKSPRQSAMFSGSLASGLGVTSNAHRIRMIATARERSATLYPGQILFSRRVLVSLH